MKRQREAALLRSKQYETVGVRELSSFPINVFKEEEQSGKRADEFIAFKQRLATQRESSVQQLREEEEARYQTRVERNTQRRQEITAQYEERDPHETLKVAFSAISELNLNLPCRLECKQHQ